jgi:Reverse transcriptase (RNA-dependent DNA polymerase)
MVLPLKGSDLSDRIQTFIVGDDRSATYSVNCSVPQGSVLSPAELIAYTEDVADVHNRHQVAHHMFADDQQLYLHTTISSAAVAKGRLLACINDVRMWCAARQLQLNADKTELIWFGSHTELNKLSTADRLTGH